MMNKIIKAAALLKNNPDLFLKRLAAEIRGFRALPNHPIQKRINGIMFEFDFTYDPAIRDMFLNKYEIPTLAAMKKILKPGATFIDVGANIGYLSAIGAGLVGKTGSVHGFEPVPEHFQKAHKMAAMNPDYKITVQPLALGEKEGLAQIDITSKANIGWNTMVPGFMKPETKKRTIDISVRRLDGYIREYNLENITLIKIDVEGFEFPVLKGMRGFLDNPLNRPAILCEIGLDACELLGYQLKELFDYMKGFGYIPFDMNNKRIEWPDIKELSNILFIPPGGQSRK
ncbi:MAG: FkbM family methyltransferase [Planctomycetes bacterium]|nr:FkbM family methyltransferase [Planctomycetota bacterium]